MSTINTLPGRELTDDELASFHGGYCVVTITRGTNGEITQVSTAGDCGNVKVVIETK